MQITSKTTVRIKLFAAARQAASADLIDVTLSESPTVEALKNAAINQFPALEKIISQSRWAINGEYALENDPIPNDAQIALIPPVSGG